MSSVLVRPSIAPQPYVNVSEPLVAPNDSSTIIKHPRHAQGLRAAAARAISSLAVAELSPLRSTLNWRV